MDHQLLSPEGAVIPINMASTPAPKGNYSHLEDDDESFINMVINQAALRQIEPPVKSKTIEKEIKLLDDSIPFMPVIHRKTIRLAKNASSQSRANGRKESA